MPRLRFPLRLLLLLPLCGIKAEQALSLEDAIATALRHNRALLNARASISEAELEREARLADFRLTPGIRTAAGRGPDTEQAEAGVEVRQAFTTGGDVRVFGGVVYDGNTDQARLRVNARQPLLRRGGSLTTLEPLTRADRALTDARRAAFERQQILVLEVAIAYEAILRAARQVDSDERSLERLQGLAALTRAREETGQVSRVDLLRLELQQGEAETRLRNSEDILENLREDFALLLGLNPLQRFTLTPPPLLELDPPDPDEGFTLALRNRIDIARALDALDDASRQIRIARRDLLPDVRLIGDLDAGGDFPEVRRESWFVGFTVEPDFNPTERRGNVARTELRREQVERQLVDLHYQIQSDVRRQLRDYSRSQTQYDIAIRNRELSDRRLELAEAMFRMGRGDAVTLSDAEDAHALSIRTELAARSEASLAAYRLLLALGTLLEPPEDLTAGE
jgi:outer membrane protein TolC